MALIVGSVFKKDFLKFNRDVLNEIHYGAREHVNDVLQDSDLVPASEFNGDMVWDQSQWTVTVKDDVDTMLSGVINPLPTTSDKMSLADAIMKMIMDNEECFLLTIGNFPLSLIYNSSDTSFCLFNLNGRNFREKVWAMSEEESDEGCVGVFMDLEGLILYVCMEICGAISLKDVELDCTKFDLMPVKLVDVTRKSTLYFYRQ